MPNRTLNYATSCLIFCLVVVALCTNFEMLLGDGDTAWHLAAGNLIRSSGAIPATDPWAFTSGGVPWVNLAWLWDVWMSWLHERFGWHGQLAFFSLCHALTMVVLYQACLLRSGNGMASFFSMFLVLISIPPFLRSMWVSNLFVATLFLIGLLIEYRGWRVWWWYAMPLVMPLWVNVHGGFIIAFVVLGAFGLQALLRKDWRSASHMTAAGLLSIAALGISPYGYTGVIDVVLKTFNTPALAIIPEFQPSAFSWSFLLTYLYIPVFLFCAMHRQAKTSLAEAILGFGLILPAMTSMRYWTFVYLFSCPILAQFLTSYIKNSTRHGNPVAMRIAGQMKQSLFVTHAKMTGAGISLLMLGGMALLFTPAAARHFKIEGYDPYHNFLPAYEFVHTHYPKHRFLTDYVTAAPFILISGGTFPVFIDGRGESAYPHSLVESYVRMYKGEKDWETILDTYRIDGVVLFNFELRLPALFRDRKGWKKVFEDKTSIVFVRE